jgi:hypothetical protein
MSGGMTHGPAMAASSWQLHQQPQVQRHGNNGKTRMGDIES